MCTFRRQNIIEIWNSFNFECRLGFHVILSNRLQDSLVKCGKSVEISRNFESTLNYKLVAVSIIIWHPAELIDKKCQTNFPHLQSGNWEKTVNKLSIEYLNKLNISQLFKFKNILKYFLLRIILRNSQITSPCHYQNCFWQSSDSRYPILW